MACCSKQGVPQSQRDSPVHPLRSEGPAGPVGPCWYLSRGPGLQEGPGWASSESCPLCKVNVNTRNIQPVGDFCRIKSQTEDVPGSRTADAVGVPPLRSWWLWPSTPSARALCTSHRQSALLPCRPFCQARPQPMALISTCLRGDAERLFMYLSGHPHVCVGPLPTFNLDCLVFCC